MTDETPSYENTKQDGKILIYKQFQYNKHQKDGNRIHYRCRDRSKFQCRATISTDSGNVVRCSGEHNHDSELMKRYAKMEEKNAIKDAARNPTVAPKTILGNLTNKLQLENPGSTSYISKAPAFKKAVQREQKKVMGFPNCPKNWEDMVIPDELKVTMDNKVFLILDKATDLISGKKIIGFASPMGLEVLGSSNQWSGDGTFDIAKVTLFCQVFIISASQKLPLA